MCDKTQWGMPHLRKMNSVLHHIIIVLYTHYEIKHKKPLCISRMPFLCPRDFSM